MTITTISSREFNQDTSGAKKAARMGPVFITDRGKPAHVRCAHLHVPDRTNEIDALIAATALVHGLTVVTRNVSDFKSIGVSLINPWDE
jgi:predicted nucleic acid-binding protein